jgi:hypothetical protein
MEIPELHVPKPIFSFIPLDPFGDPIADSESDSIINAFAKKKKADATKAANLIMQNEVDWPESFGDFGSDFNPQAALFTRHPWLYRTLPIVLPPSKIVPNHTELTYPAIPSSDEEIPDHIEMTELDSILDHIVSSSDNFPVSDQSKPIHQMIE